MRSAAYLCLFVGAGCVATPPSRVRYPAVAVPDQDRSFERDGWVVTLSRAEVAFGPAYFCAAASGSSTLCSTAVAELTTVTRIDALSGARQPLGTVDGNMGSIRSATYDLGLSWLDTQQATTPWPAAPAGHSAILEGEAIKGEVRLNFVALVDVAPQYQGQHATPTAPAVADIDSEDFILEVHVAPVRWLRQVDFDVAAVRPERPVVLSVGSVEHSAIVVGMKALAPPEFRWVRHQP